MHQCTHCQADLATNAQFCARCGTPVEESQTSSAELDQAGISTEGDLEATSKQPAIAPPATPALPTLRTRRMHPNSSIPEFPSDPWQPLGMTADATSTPDISPANQTTPASELALPLPLSSGTDLDTPQAQEGSAEPVPLAPTRPEQAIEAAQPTLEAVDTFALPFTALAESAVTPNDDPLPAPAEISVLPTGNLPLSPIPQTPAVEDVPASPSSNLPLSPIPQTPAVEEISTAPAGNFPLSPIPQTPAVEEISTAPAGNFPLSPVPQTPAPAEISPFSASTAGATPIFPPPVLERNSTPRPTPATPLPSLSASKNMRMRRNRTLIVALVVALVVLIGGTGAFVLLRQQKPTSANAPCSSQQTGCTSGTTISIVGKPTNLTFSGAVAGTMSIVAKPACQSASSGDLHTLTVNLSGTLNNQLYNFGFVIEHYNGPGIYSNATTSLLILFDVPGESTTNGWGNSDPADTGSITVEAGAQTGSISYTLSGVGTHAKTQIQATGIWTCGK